MPKGYVYLLKSVRHGRYYLGWTTDLVRRLEEHNTGKSQYTRSKGSWELVAFETYEDREAAKQRERKLKRNPRMLSQFKKRALHVFRTAQGGLSQVVGWSNGPHAVYAVHEHPYRKILVVVEGSITFTPYHGSPASQGGEEVVPTPKGSSQRPPPRSGVPGRARPLGRGTGFTLARPGEGRKRAGEARARRVMMKLGDRLDLPARTPHSAVVGPEGVVCVEAHGEPARPPQR